MPDGRAYLPEGPHKAMVFYNDRDAGIVLPVRYDPAKADGKNYISAADPLAA
ncbi:MAG: hypothetical protein IJI45_13590 [Anaerolineaceae bacterium]|nr:hypothetical protein [Anaerolineaceae bacterium]